MTGDLIFSAPHGARFGMVYRETATHGWSKVCGVRVEGGRATFSRCVNVDTVRHRPHLGWSDVNLSESFSVPLVAFDSIRAALAILATW